MKIKIKGNFQPVLGIILLLIGTYIGDTMSFIFLGLFTLLFTISSLDNKITLLLVYIPFSAHFGNTGIVIPVSLLCEIIFIIHSIIKKIYLKKSSLYVYSILIFFNIISLLLGNMINDLISNICNFTIFIILINLDEYKEKKSNFLFYFVCSLCSSCLMGIILKSDLLFSENYWVRFTGLWTDPNVLGLLCLLGIVIILQLLEIKKYSKLILCLNLIVLLYSGYRTYSRSFMYIFAIVITIYFIIIIKSRLISFFKKIIIIIIAIAIMINVTPYFVEAIYLRERNNPNLTLDNNRFEDTRIAINYVFENPIYVITGVGSQNNLSNLLKKDGYKGMATHNSYIDIFLYFGIGSIVIFCGIIILILYYKLNVFKGNLYILVILMYGTTLSLLGNDFIYIFLGLFLMDRKNRRNT